MAQAAYDAWAAANITDPQEREDLKSLLMLVAPISGEIYRLAQRCDVALSLWNTGVSSVVAALPAATAVPNPTDLAGTGPVVKENLANNLMAYLTTVGGLNTSGHLDNIRPAAGTENVL